VKKVTSRILVTALATFIGLVGCSSEKAKTTAEETASVVSVSEPAVAANTGLQTSVASDTNAPMTTASETPVASKDTGRLGLFEVSSSALGEFKLGQDAQSVIDGLTAMLGEPTKDSGWQANGSPCFDMGERNRSMNFGRVRVDFITGPTPYVDKKGDYFSSFRVADGDDVTPGAERFVFSDGLPALGRTEAALLAWDEKVSFLEYGGTVGTTWSLGSMYDQISGKFEAPDGGGAAVVRTVEAGNLCD
jgi:hypothetical protein